MKEKILKFLSESKSKDFVNANAELEKLFGTSYEQCKTVLRKMKADGIIDIEAELFRLGSTQGGRQRNWKGELDDVVIEYTFKNVPIKLKLVEPVEVIS